MEKTMRQKINRRDFYKFIDREYKPTPRQFMENHTWRKLRKEPMHYALFDRIRFYHTIRFALRYLPPTDPVILDMGVYPGTLLYILSQLLPRYHCRPTLLGVGLSITPEFVSEIEKGCRAMIETVNLDPDNLDLKGKPYTCRIPFDTESVDFAFATEVIEHLTSPTYMLQESHRVLRKGGYMLITTPNVSRVGSIFKLLAGKTNYDRLMPPGYSDPEDEWRPHFREYSMDELIIFLHKAGFKVIDSICFSDHTEFMYKDIKQRLIDLAKVPFELIPHLRGNILVCGKKL